MAFVILLLVFPVGVCTLLKVWLLAPGKNAAGGVVQYSAVVAVCLLVCQKQGIFEGLIMIPEHS